MHHLTAVLLLAAGAQAFKVAIESGLVCNGQTLADLTVANDECFGFGSSTGHQASSAYVTYTGSDDDNYVIEFFNSEDCTGPVIGEGSNGCLGLANVGTPNSLRRNPVPNARRRAASNALIMGPHDTWNQARQQVGLPPDDMPALDDGDEDLKWITLWPGQWMKVRSNVTLTHIMDTYKFDHNATFPDLNFVRPQDADNGTVSTTDGASGLDHVARDLTGTCSILYYCSLPFFAARSAAVIYESDIAPIINSIPVQRTWAVLNAGLVSGAITNYYFTKTTGEVPASGCSTTDSDKDEIISALVQQLRAVKAENKQNYESLAQCLLTNKDVGVTAGSLSFDAWTTMVTATRCNTPDCQQ